MTQTKSSDSNQTDATDSSQSQLLQEWAAARDVLKTFDDRIHDLRKYGFTFITGLISAQGFLLPFIPSSGHGTGSEAATASSGLPDEVKFGVLIATTMLIIILRWFDGNYQGYQYGAALRAKVIERFLNLELTDEISTSYEVEKLWIPKIVLYFGFEAAVVGLAWALLPDHLSDWIVYLTIGIVAESIVYYFWANPSKHRIKRYADRDWALDKLQCSSGDSIRIMMTYLGPAKEWTLEKNKAVWKIKDNSGNQKHEELMADKVVIPKGSSYVWMWRVDVEPGIYRIEVNIGDKKLERELDRKLYVVKEYKLQNSEKIK